jgi:hypothetical protein
MWQKFMWLAALSAICAAGASAAVIPLTTEDLTRNATLVITGTVEGVKSYPPDGAGIIYSEARVRIRDTLKGASPAEYVTVRYTGGEYAGLALVVMEEPTFEVEEEAVLFLAPAEGGAYMCPDGVQGKLSVVDGTVLRFDKTLNEFLAEVAAAASR